MGRQTQAVLHNLFLLQITSTVTVYTHRSFNRMALEVSKLSSGITFQGKVVSTVSPTIFHEIKHKLQSHSVVQK